MGGGAEIVLYSRLDETSLPAHPFLKDPDLGVMRMTLAFRFIEPAQKAQLLDGAAGKTCSRLE